MIFRDKDAYIYMKQRKSIMDRWAVFFSIHKQFLDPEHMDRQTIYEEQKMLNCHYDCEKKVWNMDKYAVLNKVQHTIMESLKDDGYSGIDDNNKYYHFLQDIRSTELEAAAVHVVCAHWEKHARILILLCLPLAKSYSQN